jgi:hypothetical protein
MASIKPTAYASIICEDEIKVLKLVRLTEPRGIKKVFHEVNHIYH